MIYVHILLHTYQHNYIHISHFPHVNPTLDFSSALAETTPHVTQHVLGAVRLTEVDKKITLQKHPKKGRICVCVWFLVFWGKSGWNIFSNDPAEGRYRDTQYITFVGIKQKTQFTWCFSDVQEY